jgi:hypothetical protein
MTVWRLDSRRSLPSNVLIGGGNDRRRLDSRRSLQLFTTTFLKRSNIKKIIRLKILNELPMYI